MSPDFTLAACGADNVDDFVLVTSTTCSAVTDPAGTLHYSVHATVAGSLNFGRREVVLSLIVDRNGHVLQRP